MMAAASGMTGQAGAYELSVTNVDKPPLEKAEILRRLSQLGPEDTVVLTRAETFQKKAALFPQSVFLLGWDTAVRLVAPRYYGGDAAMLMALAEMMAGGARFLVAGRADGGVFRTLADVDVPAGFAPMFTADTRRPSFAAIFRRPNCGRLIAEDRAPCQETAFQPGVVEQLNWYVYRLIDPRNGETFYVGKGQREPDFRSR